MTQAAQALAECRDRIDDVDRRIMALLNERTETVQIDRTNQSFSEPSGV